MECYDSHPMFIHTRQRSRRGKYEMHSIKDHVVCSTTWFGTTETA